jgi:hypothetical protein
MIRVLALLGSFWGLVGALALSGIRFTNSSEPERDALSTVAFTAVYGMPFVLALAAVLWKSVVQRTAVWLAGGILALLESFTAFSGVSLIFLPAAPLLILAAIFSGARVIRDGGLSSAAPVLPVSLGLLGVGIAAFLALIAFTSDPGCWVLIRYPDDHEAWQVAPPDAASIVVIDGSNGTQGSGSVSVSPPGTLPRVESTRCTGDVISPIESSVSLAVWVLAVVGLILFRRVSPVFGDVTKG